MRIQGFRGNCDFQGKLGMYPSLAWESQLVFLEASFQKTSRRRTEKFFGAAVFQKCCRGVGEQPTFAKQMKLYNEMEQKSKRKWKESQLP